MKSLNLFFILILCLITAGARAQYDDGQLRVAFIKQFAENINWPDEAKMEKFKIAAINADPKVMEGFKKFVATKKIKGKTVEVNSFTDIPKNASGYQLIYCGNMTVQEIDRIFQSIKKHNILLVTELCNDQEIVMINFLESKQDQKSRFEINKANIVFAGLEITPKLLLLGGSEVDVRELYKKSEAASRELKNKLQDQEQELKKQKAEIESTRQEITKQKQELEKQRAELVQQREEIKKQNALISTQKAKLDELLSKIAQKEALLNQKLVVLKTQEEAIKKKEELIALQHIEEAKQKEILKKQLDNISAQESKINEQKLVLLSQGARIQVQKNLLTIFIFFFVVIGILLFFVIKNSRQKQRLNLELQDKQELIMSKNTLLEEQAYELKVQSQELRSQAEELSAQADELNTSNENLKAIQEHTMSSIRCAYTIQQAMLPMDKVLNEQYSAFVLYSPKDVVSGDFFWYYVQPATETEPEKTYYAVVDCTGHGVPGAFMSLIGNRILNSIIAEKGVLDPAVMLNLLDDEVKKALRQDLTNNNDGMDAGICLIEHGEGKRFKVTYAGAKHNMLVVRKTDTEVRSIKGIRRSIGGMRIRKEPLKFVDEVLDLEAGDRLYLYSDGIVDQCNKERKSFGIERLLDTVYTSRKMPLEEQKTYIRNRLDSFSQNEAQRDDITFVGIIL